jgi:hypothetical protein
MTLSKPLHAFEAENLRNGVQRPVEKPNAWVADYEDRDPMITISWDKPTAIRRIDLAFDTDFDHPLENVLIINPESVMPFCADTIQVLNCNNQVVSTITGNHQSRQTIQFEQPVITQHLKLKVSNTNLDAPVSLFEVRCYA